MLTGQFVVNVIIISSIGDADIFLDNVKENFCVCSKEKGDSNLNLAKITYFYPIFSRFCNLVSKLFQRLNNFPSLLLYINIRNKKTKRLTPSFSIRKYSVFRCIFNLKYIVALINHPLQYPYTSLMQLSF